eukprot:1968490-Pleurochrysis_carterae.AAC.1
MAPLSTLPSSYPIGGFGSVKEESTTRHALETANKEQVTLHSSPLLSSRAVQLTRPENRTHTTDIPQRHSRSYGTYDSC